jgi:integrase
VAIYKRKNDRTNYWYIDFIGANGERIRRSACTEDKQAAQELHDRLKAESWRIKNVGEKPTYTWEDAVVRYLSEQSEKRSLETDKFHLRWVDTFLRGKSLNEINKQVFDKLKYEKLKTGVSNATVNRMLATVRKIVNEAANEWEWCDAPPVVKMLTEPQSRVRWLTHAEVDRLLVELPQHINVMVRFSLATGLRERNVTHLEWSQIDMDRRCAWITAEQSKSKKAIAVPLNTDALAVLREQRGKHETNVFVYQGNPIETANSKAWRKALVRAGIEDFRGHDLRHTWASWHVQNGTPLNVLKELGGWADLSMVMRYAHLSSEHLAEYATNSARKVATNVPHLSHQQKMRRVK